MTEVIVKSVVSYISTSIDYLLILVILLATYKNYKKVLIGDLAGTTVLILSSMLIARILGFVPQEWILGLLGLIPIYIGVRQLFVDDDDDDKVVNKIQNGNRGIILMTAIITVTTCGADNIAIYVPILIDVSNQQLVIVYITMIIMCLAFFVIGLLISKNKYIQNLIERSGKYLTSAIYIILGIYILFENGTIAHFIN
ncbi:cadmium resistance transporter [Companilactobacillus mishanensis]|uniref:Permease n=1 Tax=Companilactobacillus mishanensis TaxID=2486008 RepID=A0ABW9P5S6_9LACO|nr:cadmium resistance transporter [Companilactobacillus mishanensis]MQS44549.1 permease [Companilactobacillus mishanensis]MQS88787.1 permease [Companilactobacillus mishanensis]